MLLTGQSSKAHNWVGSSAALERQLADAGIFKVDMVVSPAAGESMEGFAPDWGAYDVVVLDYEGADWPEATQASFEKYMKDGGGLVVVHAADNAFPYWTEFNKMIGLGGWGAASFHVPPLREGKADQQGGRDESWGPRVHWRGCEAIHEHDKGGAFHPPRHDFIITVRTMDHPITQGLPEMWLHGGDELYSRLRGPAERMTILATGFANPTMRNASPYNEPALFTVDYGKGRVFHSTLGHVGRNEDGNVPAINNVGFVFTFQRGTEWAATGKVTLPVPDDFPHAYQTSIRPGGSAGDWTDLLDADLSKWEIFMGVPHTTVTGLPEGTFQAEDVRRGEPLGLGNDPKKVFSTYEENGNTILHITGEIYAGLTTLDEFENYHLQMKMRWGEKKWEPRLAVKRDSGILYHCHGEHGTFWNVWKSSLEYQVQESDIGDFISLGGTMVKAPFRKLETRSVYDPTMEFKEWKGYLHATVEPDAPHGEWNILDLYVVGDQAIHVVNDRVVLSLRDAVDKEGKPLVKGQIQIQSEAAEVEYKDMRIRRIEAFPAVLKMRAKL